MAGPEPVLVRVPWHANPLRGDKFEAAWLPHAAKVLDYGALRWGLYRSSEGGSDFIQEAVFPTKSDFDRYWYSDEIAEARAEVQGLYQVPLLPEYHKIAGEGESILAHAERAS